MDKLVEIETESWSYSNNFHDAVGDPDYYFLVTLLPKLKQVSECRKHHAGKRMQ